MPFSQNHSLGYSRKTEAKSRIAKPGSSSDTLRRPASLSFRMPITSSHHLERAFRQSLAVFQQLILLQEEHQRCTRPKKTGEIAEVLQNHMMDNSTCQVFHPKDLNIRSGLLF